MAQFDGGEGDVAEAAVIKTLICPSDTSTMNPRTDRANVGSAAPLGGTSYKGVCGNNWAWGSFTNTGPSGNNNGLDAGNGIFTSLGLFETPEQGEKSTRVVAAWIRDEKLDTLVPNEPKIMSGKVIARSSERVLVA